MAICSLVAVAEFVAGGVLLGVLREGRDLREPLLGADLVGAAELAEPAALEDEVGPLARGVSFCEVAAVAGRRPVSVLLCAFEFEAFFVPLFLVRLVASLAGCLVKVISSSARIGQNWTWAMGKGRRWRVAVQSHLQSPACGGETIPYED